MPRIAAATVADNRQLRERALVSAATSLLLTNGSFTVEQASSAAGISRPSYYEYFAGAAELTAVIVVREADALAVELAAAVVVLFMTYTMMFLILAMNGVPI